MRTAIQRTLTGFGLMVSMTACAARSDAPHASAHPAGRESLAYEVGPCFGFCPVYAVVAASDGRVDFDGMRHTAILGKKSIAGHVSAFRSFAVALAPFRPAAGTTLATQCDMRISDLQHYRIIWTAPDGRQTVLEHDRGCRSVRNDALNAILQEAPKTLGIAEFTQQVTRLGEPRG